MRILSRSEKLELLKLSRSLQLRKDFQIIKKNRYASVIKKGKVDLDEYIKFLTFSNAFANHKQKPFREINGDNFKI